nr:hypothetical protein [uncultured Campylobacter sp.]
MKFKPKFSLFRGVAWVNLTPETSGNLGKNGGKAAKFDGEAYAKARQNDVE